MHEMANIPFDREAMLQRVRNVMAGELTARQQMILTAIYFEGKTQAELAKDLQVNRSTVCRTLQRAETRLKRFLVYYA